jgi:hypothetical protein
MKKPSSQTEMSDPGQVEGGEPNYVDETASSPIKGHSNVSDDAPNYIASDPRYWEYR